MASSRPINSDTFDAIYYDMCETFREFSGILLRRRQCIDNFNNGCGELNQTYTVSSPRPQPGFGFNTTYTVGPQPGNNREQFVPTQPTGNQVNRTYTVQQPGNNRFEPVTPGGITGPNSGISSSCYPATTTSAANTNGTSSNGISSDASGLGPISFGSYSSSCSANPTISSGDSYGNQTINSGWSPNNTSTPIRPNIPSIHGCNDQIRSETRRGFPGSSTSGGRTDCPTTSTSADTTSSIPENSTNLGATIFRNNGLPPRGAGCVYDPSGAIGTGISTNGNGTGSSYYSGNLSSSSTYPTFSSGNSFQNTSSSPNNTQRSDFSSGYTDETLCRITRQYPGAYTGGTTTSTGSDCTDTSTSGIPSTSFANTTTPTATGTGTSGATSNSQRTSNSPVGAVSCDGVCQMMCPQCQALVNIRVCAYYPGRGNDNSGGSAFISSASGGGSFSPIDAQQIGTRSQMRTPIVNLCQVTLDNPDIIPRPKENNLSINGFLSDSQLDTGNSTVKVNSELTEKNGKNKDMLSRRLKAVSTKGGLRLKFPNDGNQSSGDSRSKLVGGSQTKLDSPMLLDEVRDCEVKDYSNMDCNNNSFRKVFKLIRAQNKFLV